MSNKSEQFDHKVAKMILKYGRNSLRVKYASTYFNLKELLVNKEAFFSLIDLSTMDSDDWILLITADSDLEIIDHITEIEHYSFITSLKDAIHAVYNIKIYDVRKIVNFIRRVKIRNSHGAFADDTMKKTLIRELVYIQEHRYRWRLT